MKSIGVFVNVSNQFYTVQQTYRGGKVAYDLYLKAAVSGGTLYRAFAYGVQMKDEAMPFIGCLREAGYEPKYKQARIVDARPSIRHTDWNVGIAMDVMRHLHKLDIVVIGSSDPDLAPLIAYVKERGVKVIVFSCRVEAELREIADEVIDIDESILERKIEACPA